MKKRILFILLISLVTMIALSAASAANDSTSDIASIDSDNEFISDENLNEDLILEEDSNDGLSSNDNELILEHDANKNYNSLDSDESLKDEITISPAKINASSQITYEYDTAQSLNAQLLLDDGTDAPISGAKIVVDINGNKTEYTTDDIGQISAPLNLFVGEYEAILSIADTRYEAESVAVGITVTKIEPNFEASLAIMGPSAYIIGILKDKNDEPIVGAVINYSLNNSEVQQKTTNDNGEIYLVYTALPTGLYNLTLTYVGNEIYSEKTIFKMFPGQPIQSAIIADDVDTVYGYGDFLTVKLMNIYGGEIANARVTIDINGPKDYTSNDLGEIKIALNDFAAGDYLARIAYAGDQTYIGTNRTVNVTIRKDVSSLHLSDNITTSFDNAKNLTISLKDSQNRPIINVPITVYINGLEMNTTNNDGELNISTEGLAASTYNIFIVFDGNENYTATNATARIIITKIDTAITFSPLKKYAYNKKLDKKSGYYIYATLRDAKGKALANKKIKYSSNGKVYTATTDSKGQIRFVFTQARKGNYAISASFLGDENYAGTYNAARVKVNPQKVKLIAKKKAFKAKKKVKKLTATLKNSKGKAIKGKKILFVVNKKKYTAKTNKKGVATVKVKLSKKGTYKVKVKFAGDGTYKKAVKKTSVKIK